MYDNKVNKILNIAIIFTIFLAILSLGINLYHSVNYNYTHEDKIENINLIGTYQIEGEDAIYPLPEDGNLGLSGHNTVILEGHFNKPVPVNKQIIMRLDNVKIKIFINGTEFYSFGQYNKYLSYAKSKGNVWNSTISPGISTTDIIRIELHNIYTDHVKTTFSSFLNNIYIGYESLLILNNLSLTHINTFISIFVVCIGFISIALAFIVIRLNLPLSKLLYFGGLCVSSGIWCFLDFNVQNYLFPYPVFNNSLDVLSLLFSMFFLLNYFALYLKGKCKYILSGFSGTLIVAIIITTILQILGIRDYYESLLYIQIMCLIYTPISVVCIFYEKKKLKNTELNTLIFPTVILAAGILGDALCNMLEIIPYMVWFKGSYLIFIILQFLDITKIIRRTILENARIQVLKELAYQDGLTGVKNRTSYMSKVETIKNTPINKNPISIFVFDINNLKITNDTLGHEYGDELIKRGSTILSKVFNKDFIYRIGGDEFIVIQEGIIESNYIEKFLYEIKNNNYLHLDQAPISIAYGHAIYDDSKDTCFEDVFSRADKNMYLTKNKMKEYKSV